MGIAVEILILSTSGLNLGTFKYIPCKMVDLKNEGMGIRRTFGNPSGHFNFDYNEAQFCHFQMHSVENVGVWMRRDGY